MKTLNDITVSLGVITIPPRVNLLKKLLKSIFTGSQLPDELIVVINGCSNNSIISSYIEFIKSVKSQRNYSNIKLICLNEDAPVGYCRSLIIRYSSSDYIAMVDDDVILHPLWMEKMKYSLQFKPDIVAGRVEPDPNLPYEIVKFLREKAYYNEFAFTLNYKFMKIKCSISKGIFLIDGIRGVWSNNMIIKRELIERIGNFSIILGYYKDDVGGEDTEFKMRARKSGAIFLYNSNAVVYHTINPERLTFSYIFKRSWHHGLLYSCIFPPKQLIKAFIGEFLSIFYYFLKDRKKECFLAITRFISLLSALLSLKNREDFVERRLLAIRKAKYKIITV
jgi:glycosyltransferase involved in cell wall biosynthesis